MAELSPEETRKILRLVVTMRKAQKDYFQGRKKSGARKRFLLAVALERQLDAELEGLDLEDQLPLFGGQT